MRIHPRVARACQIAIGLVFAYAALAKLGDMRSFALEVHNFRIVPIALENLVAMTLPWIELTAALALVLGVRARAGAVVATALMAVFTLAVAAALARGLDIECGCFGTGDATRVGAVKLLQNVVLLGIAFVASLPMAGRDGARSPLPASLESSQPT